MTPILESYGGEFGYDFKVSEVLKSQTQSPINRVFTISFPDQDSRDAFFSNAEYLTVRQRHFENSVTEWFEFRSRGSSRQPSHFCFGKSGQTHVGCDVAPCLRRGKLFGFPARFADSGGTQTRCAQTVRAFSPGSAALLGHTTRPGETAETMSLLMKYLPVCKIKIRLKTHIVSL